MNILCIVKKLGSVKDSSLFRYFSHLTGEQNFFTVRNLRLSGNGFSVLFVTPEMYLYQYSGLRIDMVCIEDGVELNEEKDYFFHSKPNILIVKEISCPQP